jgi:general bacterial porin, GBP family
VKRSIVASAALCTVAMTVQAATGDVDVIVVVDEGIAHIDHSLPTNDVHTFGLNPYNIPAQDQGGITALVSGAASMSRYGVQSHEDFDNGISAFFRLEGAINTSTGNIANNGRTILDNANSLTTISSASSINGQFFSRAEYVGLTDGAAGTLELGRTTAFSLDQTSEFDPLHGSGLYSPIGFSGTIGGGLGITETARLDNSVKYENKFGPWSFGTEYKIPQVNSSDAADIGSVLEGMLAYRDGPLSIELAASEARNTPALSYKLFVSDVGLRVSNASGYMLTGKYALSPQLMLSAGFEHTDQNTPSASNNWSTQITSYYGMALAGFVTAKPFASTWGAAQINVAWLGESYKFTDSFSVDTGLYDVDNGGNAHNDQYTIQQFSVMPDYRFTKRVDIYAALMLSRYHGSYLAQYSPPTLATSNAIYGAGVRFRY